MIEFQQVAVATPPKTSADTCFARQLKGPVPKVGLGREAASESMDSCRDWCDIMILSPLKVFWTEPVARHKAGANRFHRNVKATKLHQFSHQVPTHGFRELIRDHVFGANPPKLVGGFHRHVWTVDVRSRRPASRHNSCFNANMSIARCKRRAPPHRFAARFAQQSDLQACCRRRKLKDTSPFG